MFVITMPNRFDIPTKFFKKSILQLVVTNIVAAKHAMAATLIKYRDNLFKYLYAIP
ncbi:hypothetical protein [Dissulfurispira sp.]|uniref:hypothetical protein n=1 Tax=Dissulfurispira sp. TaxID=2817609 RepID=UPI002FDAE926